MKRLLTVLLVLSASPAFAQGFEVAGLAGYTTSGGITPRALGITDLGLVGSFTWGGSAGFFLSPRLGFEASWARQESALEIGTEAGRAEMFDVHVDQLQGSLVYVLGDAESRLRPLFTAGAGAALFSAPHLDGEAKLSFNLGAGLKWRATQKLGARLGARYTPTYLNDTASDYCDPFGFCQGWLHQFQFTGGVEVRF